MSELNIDWSNKHDIWNIIWLPIVFCTNIYLLFNWNINIELYFISIFLLYLVSDFIWLIIKPYSVVNPNIIYFHHLISIIGTIIIPQLDYELKYLICLATLTEINTWIRLIRNRTSGKLNIILDLLFLVSWIIIRLVIGPYVSSIIFKRCLIEYNKINVTLFIVSCLLNILTLLWTYQLINGIINKIKKYYKNKE